MFLENLYRLGNIDATRRSSSYRIPNGAAADRGDLLGMQRVQLQ